MTKTTYDYLLIMRAAASSIIMAATGEDPERYKRDALHYKAAAEAIRAKAAADITAADEIERRLNIALANLGDRYDTANPGAALTYGTQAAQLIMNVYAAAKDAENNGNAEE